ncbi:MAG: hypothetical protein ACRCXZ_08170 [Patescibacteria group bacterium]
MKYIALASLIAFLAQYLHSGSSQIYIYLTMTLSLLLSLGQIGVLLSIIGFPLMWLAITWLHPRLDMWVFNQYQYHLPTSLVGDIPYLVCFALCVFCIIRFWNIRQYWTLKHHFDINIDIKQFIRSALLFFRR